MISYCKSLGGYEVGWGNWIDKNEERGEFSLPTYQLALEWKTCPCGNQSVDIPRYENGEPQDAKLAFLGKAFPLFIRNKMWTEARYTLAQIELRANEVLTLLYGY